MALKPLILDGIRYNTQFGGISETTGVDILFNQPRTWSLPIVIEEDEQGEHISGLFSGYPVQMILPDLTVVALVTITPADIPAIVHDVTVLTVTATEMLP